MESIQGLGKQELIALNQEIVDMIKRKNEKDAAKASEMFKKGDIVHFKDPSGGDDVYGVVKKEPKNIPDTYNGWISGKCASNFFGYSCKSLQKTTQFEEGGPA